MNERGGTTDRALEWAGVGYAGLLGLFEGPAQIACVVVLLVAISRRSSRDRLREARLEWVVFGIAVWGLAGAYGAVRIDVDLSSGETTRPLMALALFVGALVVAPADERQLRRFAWAFSIAMVVNGTYGILQWAVGAMPWDHLFLANPKSGQIYIPSRVFHERASSGLFYNRLRLAHAAMVALGGMGVILLRPSVRRWVRAATLGGILLLGTGFVLTYARMAFVALAGGAAVLAVARRRFWSLTLVGLGSVGFASAFALTEYGQRRFTSLQADGAIRRAMIETAWRMFDAHPWLGAGHGVYPHVSSEYAPGNLVGTHLSNSHNLWLQIGAETGILGFVGFHVALGIIGIRSVRALHRSDAGVMDTWVFLSLSGFIILGVAHFFLHHASVGLLFWTLAGIAVYRGAATHG